jgi:hypothetical protein
VWECPPARRAQGNQWPTTTDQRRGVTFINIARGGLEGRAKSPILTALAGCHRVGRRVVERTEWPSESFVSVSIMIASIWASSGRRTRARLYSRRLD